jgi:hypothetical protein
MVAVFCRVVSGILVVTRRFSWFSVTLLLPLIGWIGLLPLLLAFPIYSDELEWKLINSRLLLDAGKLNYIFPECARGLLLDPPVSWYPARLIDAALFSDMTNPQMLRYWGIGTFVLIVLYCAWFVRFRLKPDIGYAAITGAVLAPLSLGVLPFLLVMNRPEQELIVAMMVGCTIPLILFSRKLTVLQTWIAAFLFAFLSWIIVGTHIKGIFLLPAFLLAAFLSLRRWAPWLVVLAVAGFGAVETYSLWSLRTDCPESPFLMQVFHAQSMSPADLKAGVGFFLKRFTRNLVYAIDYFRNAGFQQEYQSQWLPTASTPRNLVETIINITIPCFVAAVVVAFGLTAVRLVKTRTIPEHGPLIAISLIVCLLGVTAFQSGKNFYETSLIVPVLCLAVMLGLTATALPARLLRHGRTLVGIVSIFAFTSQLALAARFYPELSGWRHDIEAHEQTQVRIRKLIGRCGIQANAATTHVLVDDVTYTVLWPTREPYLLPLLNGWWATGVDASQVIRDRNIHAAVGACRLISPEIWSSIVSDGDYCCGTRS